MPLLPVMHQFIPMIESGRKIHTIRKERKYPFKVGQSLFLYTDSRTSKAKFQFKKPLYFLYHVSIDPKLLTVLLDGLPMSMRQIKDLAYHDGFDDQFAFFRFFERYTPDVCKTDLRLLCWEFPSYLF